MKSLPSSQIKKRLRGLAALILLSLISTIISYPEQAAAQCSSPAGVAGQIIFGEDENVPAYCDGTDWIGMAGGNPITGGGDYVPNAVFFDGSSDELRIETQLTGITDGTTLTGSFWYNETTISAQQELYSSNADFVSLRFQDYGSGPKATFGARRTDGTLILQAEVDLPTDGEWHHILFSFDTANSANNRIDLISMALAFHAFRHCDHIGHKRTDKRHNLTEGIRLAILRANRMAVDFDKLRQTFKFSETQNIIHIQTDIINREPDIQNFVQLKNLTAHRQVRAAFMNFNDDFLFAIQFQAFKPFDCRFDKIRIS